MIANFGSDFDMSEAAPPALLKERLAGLAAFLPEFESPDFQFGHWVEEKPTSKPGFSTFPYYCLDQRANAFVKTAYDFGWVLCDFDWGEWKGTSEAINLRDDPSGLDQATPEQLARLLTVCIRQDRFVEGGLGAAFESGLLTGIVRRAAALLEDN